MLCRYLEHRKTFASTAFACLLVGCGAGAESSSTGGNSSEQSSSMVSSAEDESTKAGIENSTQMLETSSEDSSGSSSWSSFTDSSGSTESSSSSEQEFSVQEYQDGLVNEGYASAIMLYPEPLGSEKLPIAVVMHGWRGSKEKMRWIGRETAKMGFAVLVVTAKNHQDIFTKPQDWVENYRASLASLEGENSRAASPLNQRLDLKKISLIGHSMGGGGAFYFADSETASLATIIALAPFSNESSKPGASITAPTLVLTGAKDSVAPPRMGRAFYDALPTGLAKDYLELAEVNHNDFERDGKRHAEIFAQVSKWLKLHGR